MKQTESRSKVVQPGGVAKGEGKGRNMAEHSMSIHCTPKPGPPHTLDLQQWSICCPQSRSSPVCVTTTTCTHCTIFGGNLEYLAYMYLNCMCQLSSVVCEERIISETSGRVVCKYSRRQ